MSRRTGQGRRSPIEMGFHGWGHVRCDCPHGGRQPGARGRRMKGRSKDVLQLLATIAHREGVKAPSRSAKVADHDSGDGSRGTFSATRGVDPQGEKMVSVSLMAVDTSYLDSLDKHVQAGSAAARAARSRKVKLERPRVARGARGGSSFAQLRGEVQADRLDLGACRGRWGKLA